MRAAPVGREAVRGLDACRSRPISAQVLFDDHQIVGAQQPLLRPTGLEDLEAKPEDASDGAGDKCENGNRDDRLDQRETALGWVKSPPVSLHFQLFQTMRVRDCPPGEQEVFVCESQTVTQIS